MSEKVIDLEKIIRENYGTSNFSPEVIATLKNCMKETAKQALEIASEEGEVTDAMKLDGGRPEIGWVIDKESIRRIAKRIKS